MSTPRHIIQRKSTIGAGKAFWNKPLESWERSWQDATAFSSEERAEAVLTGLKGQVAGQLEVVRVKQWRLK